MAAIPVNLTITKGNDFNADFNLKDVNGNFIDLTGYTVSAFMARNYTTSNVISLNAQGDLNASEGLIRISMPDHGGALTTTTTSLKVGRYVYNIFIENTSTEVKEKVIEGIIEVEPSVLS